MKANWDGYRDFIQRPIELVDDLTYDNLFDLIILTAEKHIPTTRINNNDRVLSNIWWDEECSEQIKIRKQKIINFKFSRTIENFIEAKRTIAKVKRFLKKKKRFAFRMFCGTINREMEISRIWRIVKKFNDRSFRRLLRDKLPNKNVAERLLDKFASVVVNPNFEYSISIVRSEPFSMNEMVYALGNKRNTAEGLDRISYSMIAELPFLAKKYLLNKFNGILMGDDLPVSWKNYILLGLLKNNKDQNLVNSFRPISLSSCVLNILEIMIKNR